MRNYRNLGEVVNHYVGCAENNHWETFNFEHACLWIWTTIHFVIIDYAQCSEDDFIMGNLSMKFPSLSKEEIYDCLENADGVLVVDENINEDYLLKDLVYPYKKLESIRFKILKKQYDNHPEILNLNQIYSDVLKVAQKDNGLSQEEKIAFIGKALNAKYPDGLIERICIQFPTQR